jgi:hypothetical protein
MSAYLYNVVRRPKGGFQELIGDNPDFREAFSDTTVAPAARWLQFNYVNEDGECRFWMATALLHVKNRGASPVMFIFATSASGELTWDSLEVWQGNDWWAEFYKNWEFVLEYATEHYL